MSKPDNWKIIPKLLAQEVGAGRDKIYRLLKELIKHKLCKLVEERRLQPNGSWIKNKSEYLIFEEPYEDIDLPRENPGFLVSGIPENQDDIIQIKEEEEDTSNQIEESSSESSISEEEDSILDKTSIFLSKHNVFLPISVQIRLIRINSPTSYKQAFESTAQDFRKNKNMKSFQAILEYKLKQLKEDQRYRKNEHN